MNSIKQLPEGISTCQYEFWTSLSPAKAALFKLLEGQALALALLAGSGTLAASYLVSFFGQMEMWLIGLLDGFAHLCLPPVAFTV